MTKSTEQTCIGYSNCKRDHFAGGYCMFHLPRDNVRALDVKAYDKALLDEIELAERTDKNIYELHWHGFVFPENHILLDFRIFDSVKEKLESSLINIENSLIGSIRIGGYNIKELIISGATVSGETQIPVISIDRFSGQRTHFEGKFHCASKTEEFDVRGASFADEFSFTSEISKIAIFTGCRFQGTTLFKGIQGSAFDSEPGGAFKVVGFDNSIFSNPSHTRFQDVDLRKASFRSVPLIGVQFHHVNFYQEALLRNGVFNESNLIAKERYKAKGKHRIQESPNSVQIVDDLIQEYRQLRLALESSKEFEAANDFYIGEMEARQSRKWSFVLWVYQLSSNFGTSYTRASLWLLVLLLVHFCLSVAINIDIGLPEAFTRSEIIRSTLYALSQMWTIFVHSLSTGALQRFGLLEDATTLQNAIDVTFRILIPAQAAMLVLALRHKTRR